MKHRQELVLTMLEDVLAALDGSRLVDRVRVLTPDRRVADHAAALGTEVIADQYDQGINESLEFATRREIEDGDGLPLLILPVDVPLVKASSIDAIVDRLNGSSTPLVVISPSKNGGTNALLRSPPDVIPTRFGPNSSEAHTREAKKRGVRVEFYRAEDLEIDLDTPTDIYEILRKGDSTRTSSYLESILKTKIT
jgi:2-phospho-L-lactate guanylyltransferase